MRLKKEVDSTGEVERYKNFKFGGDTILDNDW